MNIYDLGYKFIENTYEKMRGKRKLGKKYKFTNRMKNSKNLVIILAGYQEYLWENVFGRFKKFIPGDFDVCIVVPGKDVEYLEKLCEENQWSYLSNEENKISQSQNIAIHLHEKAQNIFKFDEDIFISEGYFEGMLKTYENAIQENKFKIGFIAPLINVNGFTYVKYLEKLQKKEEYERIFGKARYTLQGENIYFKAYAAKYIWENSLPIETVAKKVCNNEYSYSICPHQFSIGAIFIKRSIWEFMGMFDVTTDKDLGMDEIQLCTYCIKNSNLIIIANDVFAGHLAFANQKRIMKSYYLYNKEKFDIKHT